MKLRFGLRELLGYVTLAAFVSALFVYLPAWDAAFLAALICIGTPLRRSKSERLEALFWCFGAALICYHLGLLISVYRDAWLAYGLTWPCWVATIGYGLRKHVRLRNRIWTAGLVGMFIAWIIVPDYFVTDSPRMDNERPHWFGIALLTAIASCLPLRRPPEKIKHET